MIRTFKLKGEFIRADQIRSIGKEETSEDGAVSMNSNMIQLMNKNWIPWEGPTLELREEDYIILEEYIDHPVIKVKYRHMPKEAFEERFVRA